jgi:hypothetical protein
MPDGPGLVIPVRLNADPALQSAHKLGQGLKTVGDAGTRAGHDVAKGMEEAKSSTTGLGDEMAGLIKTQAGLAGVQRIAGMINQSMREAADYTKKTADGFISVQKAVQGISALVGKGNSNQFTLQEARSGAAANLKPEEWASFRDSFLSTASNYVGDKPTAKLNDKEADEFQAAIAEFAKQHHVASSEAAEFAGGLLAQQKGPTTAKEMKARAGRVFATLEASSAPVSRLLPSMTRAMAQGLSAEEAAPVLAQLPEIAPMEEGTHLLRVLSEVRRLNVEGKADQFGITKGMSTSQQLDALIGNLSQRSEGGEDLDAMLRDVTHEDIAANTLRGLVRQGPAGMKQWKDILANTPDNAIDTSIAEGRQTSAGQQMHSEANFAMAELERGEKHAARERLKMDAEAELIKQGRFDEHRYEDDFVRQPASLIKGTPVRSQLINERATELAQERAGIPEGERYQLPLGAHQKVADTIIERALDRQTKLLERQVQLAEEAAKAKPGPPLVAVPGGANNGPFRQ